MLKEYHLRLTTMIALCLLMFETSLMPRFSSSGYASSLRMKNFFNPPSMPPLQNIPEFISRNQDILRKMNFSPKAVENRLAEISRLRGEAELQPVGTPAGQRIAAQLLEKHLEQAMYLENLRGLGIQDSRYPDIDHFIKVERRQVISLARQLAQAAPRSSLMRFWKTEEIISRMRIGDISVSAEARPILERAKGTQEAARIQALGSVLSLFAKTGMSSGNLQSALALQLDPQSRAAIKLLLAEGLAAKDPNQALELFQQAGKEGLGIKTPEGEMGIITARAATRTLQFSLKGAPLEANTKVAAFFRDIGAVGHAKYYLEQIALNNIPSRPRQAIELYETINNLRNASREQRTNILLRTIDIALIARDLTILEDRWKQAQTYKELFNSKQGLERLSRTQAIAWENLLRSKTPATVEQFIRLHDFFTTNQPAYRRQDQWQLRSLEALARIEKNAEVARRADLIIKTTQNKETKLTALRFSARAKEGLIGITRVPNFVVKSTGEGGTVFSYLNTLEQLIPMIGGVERERAEYQFAYLSLNFKDKAKGKKMLLSTIGKYPGSSLNPMATSYLIGLSLQDKDYEFLEMAVRSFAKWKQRPQNKAHANLDALLEFAVFEQASALANKQEYVLAADKFVAYQKEFPKNKRADRALHLASRNYTKAKKIDESIKQIERLLELYPQSPLAKESLWAAATQAQSIGQLVRSATHYTNFSNRYPTEGFQRKALLRAAEMHKSMGRFSDAISSYEKYLKLTANQKEKIAVAKEIATMQQKYGAATEALASYDRVIQLSQDRRDKIWARYEMVNLFLRQGMEIEARAAAQKLSSITVSDQPSLLLQTRARFAIGKLDTQKIQDVNPMREQNLYAAVQSLMKIYDETKRNLISTCEAPGNEWCSLGYYEAAKLADLTAEKLLEVQPPPTLDPALAGQVSGLVRKESERMITEARTYAAQAATALSQGAPDAETAERIRAYAQEVQGRESTSLP